MIGWEELSISKFLGYSTTLLLVLRSILYPISLVKTRLQVLKVHGDRLTFRGMVRDIFLREGFRGFYHGGSALILGVIPGQMAYFLVFESMRAFAPLETDRARAAVAGMTAGVVGTTISTPADVVSQQQMIRSARGLHEGPLDAVARIYRTEGGLRGLYRGYFATFLVAVPASGVFWATYSAVQPYFHAALRWDAPGDTLGAFCAGAVTGAISNPLDVAKTVLQVNTRKETASIGIFPTIRRLWREDGPSFMLRGVQARMLNMGLHASVMITAYETVKRFSVK